MIIRVAEVPTAYINLEQHIGNNRRMKEMLSGLEFKDFKRIDAVKGQAPLTRLAVADSHKKAIESFDNVPFLVLEDDCTLINEIAEIDVPDDADIILLGIWDAKLLATFSGMRFLDGTIYEDISESLVKANKMNGMHAVLYVSERSVDLAKRVFELSHKTHRHIDNLFRELTPFINVYALKNPMFAQTSKLKETTVTIDL